MMGIAGALGALGLMAILSRKTLLGVLVGIQLLIWGSSMAFVAAGVSSGALVPGHLFGLFVTLGGVAVLVVGYALAIRLSFLRGGSEQDENAPDSQGPVAMTKLKTLKH